MIEATVVAFILLSGVSTVVVLRSQHLERIQKVAQVALVWLLPFIGGIFVLVFHSVVYTNMNTKLKPDQPQHYKDEGLAYDLQEEIDD